MMCKININNIYNYKLPGKMSTMESNARALAKPARADMYTCIHVQPFHCYADID